LTGSPLDRDRLSAVSATLLLALAASRLVDVPLRRYEVNVFGSPLGLSLSATTLLFLLVAGLAAAGMHWLLSNGTTQPRPMRTETFFWLLPALTGIGLLAWLASLDELGAWTMAMLATAILIPLALALEHHAAGSVAGAASASGRWQLWARPILIYVLALVFPYALYAARLRLLAGGPLLFGFLTLLAARLFWEEEAPVRAALLYGSVVGILVTQFYWLLNYLPLSALRGASLLLLAFYLVAGLLPRLIESGWRPRLAGEYALVGLLVGALIFLFVP
jgi:hypothetical protein